MRQLIALLAAASILLCCVCAPVEQQPAGSGGSRNRRDKKTFRGWQERARSEAVNTGLTLPVLDVPTVLQIRRSDVELEWLSSYRPRTDDTTPAGYEVTVEEQQQQGQEQGRKDEQRVVGRLTVQFLLQDLVELPDVTRSAQASRPVYKYRARVRDLKPSTSYAFRIAVFYDEARGAASDPSASIVTLPLTPPNGAVTNISVDPNTIGLTSATISFSPPDDGGLPILGYHVYAQRQDDETHTGWVLLGDLNSSNLQKQTASPSATTTAPRATTASAAVALATQQLKVSDLLPGTTYRLKLVAFNQLGDSTTHSLSPAFTTKKRGPQGSGSGHIKGVGHPDRSNNDKSYVQTSAVISVDDKGQRIVAGNQTFDVWTCHWSPRSFQVSAEAVWVNPPMLQSAITNADLIKGRIALVRRGDVPFVTKAMAIQAAGGLGVIVLDDGRCKSYDQACLPGAQKHKSELFAKRDMPKPWQGLKIPVVFALQSTGDSLISHANIQQLERINQRSLQHDEL